MSRWFGCFQVKKNKAAGVSPCGLTLPICVKYIFEPVPRRQWAIAKGEVIEDYPDDYPYPSCLILGEGIHIVAGIGDDMLWLITAYRPDLDQWSDDLKTRREKP